MIRKAIALTSLAVALASPASSINAEETEISGMKGPADSTGIGASVLGAVVLEHYGDLVVGADLRAREITVAPGGHILLHSHKERPGIAFVIEGEIIEHRNDSDAPITHKAGSIFFEDVATVHWSENATDKVARILTIDIVKPAGD